MQDENLRPCDVRVLRQAYVLLSVIYPCYEYESKLGNEQKRTILTYGKKAIGSLRSSLAAALEGPAQGWTRDIDYNVHLVESFASIENSSFASVKAQELATLSLPSRKTRDRLEEAAASSVDDWQQCRVEPGQRTKALLLAALACIEPIAKLLIKDKSFGSIEYWTGLDGVNFFGLETPRLQDARTRWTARLASFVDEATQIHGERLPAWEAVIYASTFGNQRTLNLDDVSRLFGVTSAALKTVLPPDPRKRGSLTTEMVRRALCVQRVRPAESELVKHTTMDGARIHIYRGPHPLVSPTSTTAVGHADFDMAVKSREAWSPSAPAEASVPLRELSMMAILALESPQLRPMVRDVVRIEPIGRLLGVRFLIEFEAG